MSFIEGLKGYYALAGLKGVAAISLYRTLGVPKEITVHPSCVRYPIHLRLRTSDTSLYHDILLSGAYAEGVPAHYARTIVDIGANNGMATLWYANRFHGAKIVAVEPEASNFEVLCRNVRHYPNIIPIHAALWSYDGFVNLGHAGLDDTPYGKWDYAVTENGEQKVRAITMPTLMRETGIEDIDILKMDIEGGEYQVFQSAEWMKHVNVLAIELHDHIVPGCRKMVTAAASGYSLRECGEMTVFMRHFQAQ